MKRVLFFTIAALVTTIGAHAQGAAGPNLDVAGIKIGMGVKDAMAALKAENPKFSIQIPNHQLEGFPMPLHPWVDCEQAIGPDNDGETITLLFTMPPSREVVWGIKRLTSYRAGHRPSTEATLAALRTKYGPESVPAADPRTKNLAWVFDDKGQLMPVDKAKQVLISCSTAMELHFGFNDLSSFNDIQTGKYGSPECGSDTIIQASVQSTQLSDGSNRMVVYNLMVEINLRSIMGRCIGRRLKPLAG
jgi:hypothetical protein